MLRFCCDIHDYCYSKERLHRRIMVDGLDQLALRLLQYGRGSLLLGRRRARHGFAGFRIVTTMLRWTESRVGCGHLPRGPCRRGGACGRSWFSPEWTPFFTNSGRAVAFTAACVLIAGLLAGAPGQGSSRRLDSRRECDGGRSRRDDVRCSSGPGPARSFPIAIVHRHRHPGRGQLSGSARHVPVQSAEPRRRRCPRPITDVNSLYVVSGFALESEHGPPEDGHAVRKIAPTLTTQTSSCSRSQA